MPPPWSEEEQRSTHEVARNAVITSTCNPVAIAFINFRRGRGRNRAERYPCMADTHDAVFARNWVTTDQAGTKAHCQWAVGGAALESWELCCDGGFVHLSRGVQQVEEPMQGPFGLLHSRLFSNKHIYSCPKAKMKTKNIESPVFAGDVLSSSECLRTGEETRWAVEVQSEWTSGFDDIVVGRLGEGCIGRRRASTESPVSLVDFLPATATGSPETPQAPATTTALAPGGCTGLITAAFTATASPPQQHRPDHMALHCVSEVAYKPSWSPRLGAGAPMGHWQWLVVEVHALLGCSVDTDTGEITRIRA